MYAASAEFHQAIQDGNEQMPLLIFRNGVFTASDINIDKGITFNDYFNLEEDIAVGQALSNEIQFSIFNDTGLLDDFEFGEFTALLGVLIFTNTYTQEGIISVTSGDNTYVATDGSPYLTRNGTAMDSPPAGKLANIIVYDGLVYGIQTDGRVFIYNDETGERVTNIGDNVFDNDIAEWVTGKYINADGGISSTTNYKYSNHMYPIKPGTRYYAHFNKTQTRAVTIAFYDKSGNFLVRTVLATASSTNEVKNTTFTTRDDAAYYRFSCGTNTSDIIITENIPRFMAEKFKQDTKYGARLDGNILTIWTQGTLYTYEFVPLGVFIANRPNVPTVNEIDFLCNDRMMLFEKDMPEDSELGLTYPLSINTLLTKMCEYVGVPMSTGSFINDSATISKRPEEFNSATMRDVLKWIAEAAGGNAKFDRNGNLKIVWLRQTQQAYGPNMYKSFNPYWYETAKVTKLENRASDGSYDKSSGSGDEIYLIQDNPLLRGVE